ncbi:MAG: hypothetical protein IJ523_08220 [Succinivibrionaceae bacterium]|nr:hypothetical protein [Succinivibrionaceae bacterium]
MAGVIVNSNRSKFALRALIAAGLSGVDVTDMTAVEDFYKQKPDYLRIMFDMRIYPPFTADEYAQILGSFHPYALLYHLSAKDKITPVNPAMARQKPWLDSGKFHELANSGSKYYSIYVADTNGSPIIPKDSYVEFKTRESRVSGKLLNLLMVNPESVIAFNASDCAKTIFSVIENYHSYFCAYWDFDFDVYMNSDFPNTRKVISRAYTHGDLEFVPNPSIGVIPYAFSKDDFWNLPNMFSGAKYLADVKFEYACREIREGRFKGPLSEKKQVHKNILTNIPDRLQDPIENIRPYVAYHWFFSELPDATMDIFTDLAQVEAGDEFMGTNQGIVKYYVASVLSLAASVAKAQDDKSHFPDGTVAEQCALCRDNQNYLYEMMSRVDDCYQNLIDTNPAEKLLSGLQ